MKLLVFLTIVSLGSAYSKDVKNICLTGSTVKILKRYGQSFLNGANLALEKNGIKNFKISKHFYDKAPLAAITATKQMNKDCSAIIGYSNQNDLSLVKNIVSKDIPVISIYGEIDESFGSHFKTMQPTPSFLVSRLFEHLDRIKLKYGKVLIITSNDQLSFIQYREAFTSELKKRGIKFSKIGINSRSSTIESIKEKIRPYQSSSDTIISLNLAILSAQIVNMFGDRQIQVLGTKNFGSSATSGFYSNLKNKNITGYFARHISLNSKSPEIKSYIETYKKRFNRNPYVISMLVSDAVEYLLESYNEKEKIFKLRTSDAKLSKFQFDQSKQGNPNSYSIIKITKDSYLLDYEKVIK